MEAALQERTVEAALPARHADRLARIAWLVARSHDVRLDDVLEGAKFRPAATQARAAAIALSCDLLRTQPGILARYFSTSERAIEAACHSTAERMGRDPEFATTMSFLKSSCAAVMK